MASKLFIGGLAFSTTSEGLREFFAQCGNVTSAAVITDQFSGRSRGFGFVEMSTPEEVQAAVQQLNGRDLDGRQLKVEVAKSPGAGGGGRGGGPRDRHPGGGGGGRW
jgi:cold-inducible RNA-binding protein